MKNDHFSLKLTDAQYRELARLWHEYMLLGPARHSDEDAWTPLDFCEWLDVDHENPYGLPEVEAFLAEKERREGTALKEQKQQEQEQEQDADYPTGKKGFASMSRQRLMEVASAGGRSSWARRSAHKWTPQEAAAAGVRSGATRRRQSENRNNQHEH